MQADYVDCAALRFLRARKWDVGRAVAMLCATIGFRLDMDIEGLLAAGENGLKEVPGFLNQYRRGISYLRGNTDAPGEHPIYYIHVARHFANAQKIETLQRFVLLALETTRQLCTPPLETAVIVFDMTGFGLKNMDWQGVLALTHSLEAYYPESLHRVYVHAAPWIFRGIWQVLSPMLDPVVRDKIAFTNKAQDLENTIPADKLRVAMGGSMEWDWDYTEPDPHENDLIERTDIADRIREERDALWGLFEEATLQWCQAASDREVPDLAFRRLVLQKQIRLKHLQLNPYIRATNVYQRQGILTEANAHAWEYPQRSGALQTQFVGERHDIPALVQWLLQHKQDVFASSHGTKFGACGTDRTPDLIPSWVMKHGGPVSIPGLTNSASGAGRFSSARTSAMAIAAGRQSSNTTLLYQKTPNGTPSAHDTVSSHAGRSSGDLSTLSHEQGFATPPESGSVEDAYNGHVPLPAAYEPSAAPSARFEPIGYNESMFDGSGAGGSGSAQTESFAGGDSYAYGVDKGVDDSALAEAEAEADADSDDTDAPETSVRPDYIPKKPLKQSQVQITEQECREDLGTVHTVMDLFLDSRMLEAEEICVVNAGTRLYKAAGMSLINFVKAYMTFESNDIQTAIHCCKHTAAMASLLRKKHGVGKFIQNKKTFYRSMTFVQLHAEILFAESTLLVNVLRITKARGGIGLLKQALGLRTAYIILQDLYRFIELTDARFEQDSITGKRSADCVAVLDADFRSGVYFSYAACSLVLSFMPGRAHKVLEGLGYLGDRQFALQVLQRAGGWSRNKSQPTVAADAEGILRPLCDILLIVYHVVLPTFVPVLVDIRFADLVLQWNLQRYPHGIFFLYFQARLYAAQALPEKSIEYLRNSIEAQRSFKQLDHISFFDLALTYLSTCDFNRAYECFDVLSRESNWSRAIYQYARAVCLVESGMDDQVKSATIMRTVAGLKRKLAGTTIPLEQFCTDHAKLFVTQNNRLPLSGLEFSYLWHCMSQTPVFLLIENTLTRIDDFIDELEGYSDLSSYGASGDENEYWSAYCLSFFLRGVALRYVAFPDERTIVRAPPEDAIGRHGDVVQDALLSFHKVVQQGHRLDKSYNYLVYFAHFELGRLLECMGNRNGAAHEFDLVLSSRPLEQYGRGLGKPGGEHMTRWPMSGRAHYLLENMCMLRTRASVDAMRTRQSRVAAGLYEAGAVRGLSSVSLGSHSVGARTSLSGQSSFFAAAAPGTTLSDVLGQSSVRAPSSVGGRRSDYALSEVSGEATWHSPPVTSPPPTRTQHPPVPASSSTTSPSSSSPMRQRSKSGVSTSRMRSMRG